MSIGVGQARPAAVYVCIRAGQARPAAVYVCIGVRQAHPAVALAVWHGKALTRFTHITGGVG